MCREIRYRFDQAILDYPVDLPDELFFRGKGIRIDDTLVIPKNSRISFDTYFNSLSTLQWAKYTDVANVSLELEYTGCGVARIWSWDGEGVRLLSEHRLSSKSSSTYIISNIGHVSELGKLCYLELESHSDSIILLGVHYYTDVKPNIEPKFAFCFCTYRRERELLDNVARIVEGFLLPGRFVVDYDAEIFIADNGGTLRDHPAMHQDHVHYYANPNYGGSAGFARCMIEACLQKKFQFTHLILMDDDARIEPFVLRRTHSFVSYLTESRSDCIVGAARFASDRPWLQSNNLERWEVGTMRHFGSNMDMRSLESVINNDQGIANYAGWFYSCIPVRLVTKSNLPLPMFFQHDDVEYGLRAGRECISINGACVWHPSPGSSIRPCAGYYSSRNDMMIYAKHYSDISRKGLCVRAAAKVLGLALTFDYASAKCCIKGYQDFYRGIGSFIEANPEVLHSRIIEEYRLQACHFDSVESMSVSRPTSKSKVSRTIDRLCSSVLPVWNSRVYFSGTCIDQFDYRFTRRIMVITKGTGNGLVLEKSYIKLLSLIFDLLNVGICIFRKHDTFLEWARRIEELHTLDFWEKYLSLHHQ